jgi:septum formation protein
MICDRVSDVKTASYAHVSHLARPPRRLILASTSRYRRELLSRLGLAFETESPDTPELVIEGEAPAAMAARLALAKARSIKAPDALVIGSDQVASLDGRLLRKPGNHATALRQLKACQGRTVVFDTAVAVVDTRTGAALEHADRTEVRFASLEIAALDRYLQREQPLDCAGSFKSEGLGVALFERIDSSDPTALIGLPLIWVARALRELGADPLGPVDS